MRALVSAQTLEGLCDTVVCDTGSRSPVQTEVPASGTMCARAGAAAKRAEYTDLGRVGRIASQKSREGGSAPAVSVDRMEWP